MKKCEFIYKPTFLYVHASDSIEEARDGEYLWSEESEVNGCGTLDYCIKVDGETHFEFRIPLGYIEEEDLDLSAYEGKILVMEINEWSTQTLEAFLEEDEDLKPCSSYMRLAYNFNGIFFGDDFDNAEEELQDYDPMDYESEERYFEYYQITEGKAVLVED